MIEEIRPVRAVVAGVGQTDYGKLPGRSTVSMNVEACRKALEDAGIERVEVDGLWAKVPTSKVELLYAQKVAEALGLRPSAGGVLDLGGASAIGMISLAAMSIEAGLCETALITTADNPRTGTRAGYDKTFGNGEEYGWLGVAAGYGMIARAHMLEFGTTAEDFGRIAVETRSFGAKNPVAHLKAPITLDDYFASPYVVDPLRRDDCALVSDGAAAVVVTSEVRARRLGVDHPIRILGFGQGHESWDVPQRRTLISTCAADSAESAFAMAGLRPSDIDVAQIYDCFTITTLMTLEDYGFFEKGAITSFLDDGGMTQHGPLPVNTAGGLLSETGMPGMQLVVEAVRQLRCESVSQVKDAEKAIVSGQGGVMHTHATLLLGS